ncbi:MAG TPA: MCE family protein [Nocardioides sp.]|nr:MCE family protein [Nocardioides sp.]
MSEILFAHSRLSPRTLRRRLAAVGVLGAMGVGAITATLGLQTLGVVSGDVRVTVHLPTTGDTLGINSDVKYAGLRVGRVVSVDPGVARHDPTAVVLVQSREASEIPATVRARVLPGTLFGNEYVDLVGAGSGSVTTGHLRSGDQVPADRSVRTLRLMDTFAATQRLLAAVDPSQWDTALSQLSGALAGRGHDIGGFMADAERMLGRWTDLQPAVIRDLRLLATDADTADGIEPQLVRALRASRPLARTLVAHAGDTDTILSDAVGLLDGSTGVSTFLALHGPAVARLLDATAATLRTFAERHPAFESLLAKVPQLLRNGAAAVRNGRIQMEGVLAPQMMDPYGPADCPRYGDLAGPNCPGSK